MMGWRSKKNGGNERRHRKKNRAIKEGGSENGPGGAHGGAELGRVGGKMRFSGQKSRS